MDKNFKSIIKTKGLLRHSRLGFTLTEIMIVLAIIAMIGAFVAGRVGDQLAKSKVSSTKIQMRNLMAQLETFRMTCNLYPTTDQTLRALVEKPTTGIECKNYPDGGFIQGKNIPQDAWNYDFAYESDGRRFKITSLGSDGQPGGEGDGADIDSDNLDSK